MSFLSADDLNLFSSAWSKFHERPKAKDPFKTTFKSEGTFWMAERRDSNWRTVGCVDVAETSNVEHDDDVIDQLVLLDDSDGAHSVPSEKNTCT